MTFTSGSRARELCEPLFNSDSSSLLLLRGAPGTAWILRRSFTPKRHRQLRVKDLPKVPTCRPERESNPEPFGRKATNLPMSHHAPLSIIIIITVVVVVIVIVIIVLSAL